MSGTTTRSQSPNSPTEEQRLHQERRMQLVGEREASEPETQFSAQVEEERRQLWHAEPRAGQLEITSDLYIFQGEARETSKRRWIEQGIWNKKWNHYTIGQWNHEATLEFESESETDTEPESSRPLFSSLSKEPELKWRRPKSDEDKRRIAERRVVREREHDEASRPYHQFVYLISMERRKIKESENEEGAEQISIRGRTRM